jgi:Ran GTPase-activating protein (RanGAP) involved in mRNA processing and transport
MIILVIAYSIKTESAIMPIDQKLVQRIKENDPSLTTIEIKHATFTFNELVELCRLLCDNTTVTELRFIEWEIVWKFENEVVDSVQALGKVLTANTTLTSLELEDCALGFNVGHIIEPLKNNNRTLTSLKLTAADIGKISERGIAAMLTSNTTLTTLGLGFNYIDDLTNIAHALKTNETLTYLDLQANFVDEDENNNKAMNISELTSALKTNKTLKFLDLGGSFLNDDDTSYISNMLKSNTTLTALNLGTARGIGVASSLSTNTISDEGIEHLTDALKINKTLRSLDLKDNTFTDKGAEHISVMLRTNDTLTSLELSSKLLTNDGVETVFNALASNYSLVNFAINTKARLLHYPNPEMEFIGRNQRIASCLKILYSLADNISNIGEIDPAKQINKLKKLIPSSCGLTKMSAMPTAREQNSFPNNRYFLTNDGFFHYNKATKSLAKIENNFPAIKEALAAIEETDRLSNEHLTLITTITDHRPAITLSQLDETHFLPESYRLFPALWYINNARVFAANASENSKQTRLESEIRAFEYLLPNFAHPQLQKIADLILTHFIFHGISAKFFEKEARAFWQLGFCLFAKQLDNPDLQVCAYNILFNLLNQDKLYTFDEKNIFEGTTQILSSTEFAAMRTKALSHCEADLTEVLQHINHINGVLAFKSNEQKTFCVLNHELQKSKASEQALENEMLFLQDGVSKFAKALAFSPHFMIEFKKSFPQKTQFVIVGDLCLELDPKAFVINCAEQGSLPTKEQIQEQLKQAPITRNLITEKIEVALASCQPKEPRLSPDALSYETHGSPEPLSVLGKRKASEQSTERLAKQPRFFAESLDSNLLHFKKPDPLEESAEDEMQIDLTTQQFYNT